MPPINFEQMQIAVATQESLVGHNFDTATQDAYGMYPGRLQLMSQMLGEVAAKQWMPSGTAAVERGIVSLTEVTFNLDTWETDRRDRLAAEQQRATVAELRGDYETVDYARTRIASYQRESHCGFSACAVGHAMYDQRFEACGLVRTDYSEAPVFINGRYEHSNWDAVTAFFGIPLSIAEWLFQPYSYPVALRNDPSTVKDRVDQLIRDGRLDTCRFVEQYEVPGEDSDS